MEKPNQSPSYMDDETDTSKPATQEQESESDSGATSIAMVPKNALMGQSYEVGDKVVMRVKAIHGDEVELSCESGDSAESEAEPETELEAEDMSETGKEPAATSDVALPADSGMSSMMD